MFRNVKIFRVVDVFVWARLDSMDDLGPHQL